MVKIGQDEKILSFPQKSDSSQADNELMFSEVFVDQHYRRGLEYIQKLKNPIVLDLGANIGMTALYFSQTKCQIHAVEPDNDYYEALLLNTKGLNIKTYKTAIGAINVPDRLLQDMSLYFTEKTDKAQLTKGQDIKTFFDENKIEHVDLMKIDVEGAEYEIFSTPAFSSAKHKIDMIVGEAHFKPYPCRPQDITHLLEDHGYKVEWLPIKNAINKWELGFQVGDQKVVGKLCYRDTTMFVAEKT